MWIMVIAVTPGTVINTVGTIRIRIEGTATGKAVVITTPVGNIPTVEVEGAAVAREVLAGTIAPKAPRTSNRTPLGWLIFEFVNISKAILGTHFFKKIVLE